MHRPIWCTMEMAAALCCHAVYSHIWKRVLHVLLCRVVVQNNATWQQLGRPCRSPAGAVSRIMKRPTVGDERAASLDLCDRRPCNLLPLCEITGHGLNYYARSSTEYALLCRWNQTAGGAWKWCCINNVMTPSLCRSPTARRIVFDECDSDFT